MKKNQIANLIMVGVILLIVAGGVIGVGSIRGCFDTTTDGIAYLTEMQGTVNMERSGVIYPTEGQTVLRAGDKIMTQPGATAVIRFGDDAITLGGNAELTVTDPGSQQLTLTVVKGEVFVSNRQSVKFYFALGEAVVENATAALSVRDGAQTVYVFQGTVSKATAGQATEYVGETVSTRAMQLEGLNEFLLAQVRTAIKTVPLCYTQKDLDDLEAKRQQAIQDMLNGQNKPGAHAHSYTVSVIAPSCNTIGYTQYTCDCGETYTADETAALAHKWGPWTTKKPATTQETGVQQHICILCQAAEEKTTEKLSANHIHSYTQQVMPPSCTQAGYTVYLCDCGHTYTGDSVSATDHNYTAQVIAPTCETQGYTIHQCACGKTYTDAQTSPIGHTWGSWTTIKEATETVEGLRRRTCAHCNKQEEQSIAKKEPGLVGYVYLEIRCDTILNNMADLTPGKEEFVPSNGVILPMVEIPFYENETVFEVLNRVCKQANIQIEYSWTPLYGSYYIEGINHLYEFDCGEQSGWMYKVNEWFPNYGCSSYYLDDGDMIVWCYTCRGLGQDVGCEWMGEEG